MNFAVALSSLEAWVFLPVALPICVWAVYSDITQYKIRNEAVLGLIIGFLVLGPFAMELSDYFWRFANFGIVLGVGFVLWQVSGLGAGDAKLAAAIALYINTADSGPVLMIWLTAMVAMLLLYSRSFVRVARNDGVDAARKMELPFGIALAPTLVIYLILGLSQGGV